MSPLNMKSSLLLASVLAAAPPVFAQTQRSGGGGDAQKFMQQYQQLAAEKTSLQSQLVQMKKDLDAAQTALAAAKKERDALKAHAGGSSAAVARLTASKEAAEKGLEQSKQRMNELVGRFRDMATNLKEVEADRTSLRKTLDERNQAFDQCAENNLQLYEINGEILNRYEHGGRFGKSTVAEPFTKLARIRMENLVDEYRARALEMRVKKKTP
jgi:chromosome segregation ATPase